MANIKNTTHIKQKLFTMLNNLSVCGTYVVASVQICMHDGYIHVTVQSMPGVFLNGAPLH